MLRFEDGATVDYFDTSDLIHDRTPTISSFEKLPRPAIDPFADRLLVRYATAKPTEHLWRIVVFDLDDASSGRLTERALPNNDELGLGDDDLLQGITACGQYAYLLYGGPRRDSWRVTLDLFE